MKLTVLTFNIRHGKGADHHVNLKRIAEVIQVSHADIVGLNEVDCHFAARSEYQNQAQRLGELLHMDYTFGASVTHPSLNGSKNDRQYGNAILSRYPLLHKETHLFQPKWMKAEGRSVLEATVRVGQHLIDIFVSHLSLNPWFSWKQRALIVQRAKQSECNGKKILILGDWNMRPHSRNWSILTSSYKDAWYEFNEVNGKVPMGMPWKWLKGWSFHSHGSTFPSHSPKLRLDYIFVSQCFQVDKAEVLLANKHASDHLPVLACLDLETEESVEVTR